MEMKIEEITKETEIQEEGKEENEEKGKETFLFEPIQFLLQKPKGLDSNFEKWFHFSNPLALITFLWFVGIGGSRTL